MGNPRSAYDDLVFGGLADGAEDKDKSRRKMKKAALDRAHDIRKFEIELYWRRNLYFWGFNVALFAGVGLLFRVSDANPNGFFTLRQMLLLGLSLLGLFVTFAWHHVHLGSKAWQKNWELHIDCLEDDFTGRLHKATLGNREDFFSVSRINGSVIIAIGIFWLFVALLLAFPTLADFIQCKFSTVAVGLLLLLATVLAVLRLCIWPTGSGTFGCKCGEDKKHQITVRDAPDLGFKGEGA